MVTEVHQSHSGTGDNIGRDKIVYSMQSGDFKTVIQSIMSMIQLEKYEDAKHKLELLQEIDSKNNDIENLIKIINIHYNHIVNKKNNDNALSIIKNIIRQTIQESLIKDLAVSVLVYLTGIKDKEESLAIYKTLNIENGYYLNCIYNKFLASEEELEEYFNINKSILTEYELINVCLGLCRVKNFELAFNAIEIVKKTLNERYTMALSIGIELEMIYPDGNYQPIMYADKEISNKIIELAKNFSENIFSLSLLIDQELRVLICLLMYTGLSVQPLINIGIKFIDQIRNLDEFFAKSLEKIKNITELKLNNDLLFKLENSLNIDEIEAIDLSNLLYTKNIDYLLVHKWIEKDGSVAVDDKMLETFFIIFFKSFILLEIEKEYSYIEEYKSSINSFISTYGNNIKNLLPSSIVNLCDNLRSQKNPFFKEIKEIIELVLSENNVISPLYTHYLNSLLALEQYTSLQNHLDKIPENEWNFEIFIIQSSCFALNNDYLNAKKNIDKALEIHNLSAYVWLNKLSIELKISTLPELKNIIHEIPFDVFTENSNYVFSLLKLISNNIDYVFSQKIIAKLFISDPTNIANEVCKLHFNAITSNIDITQEPIVYPEIRYGVEYELQSKTYFKLLINSSSKNSHFIESSSVLGKILSNLKIGEFAEYDFNDLKLLNIIPADIAVFRIAKDIVEENRHLSKEPPIFYSFTVSENDAVNDIKKMLSRFDSADKKKEKLADKTISMYLKGKWLLPNSEVEAALSVLQDDTGNACLYQQNGILMHHSRIFLDIYSFIFLCLNNLYKSLINLKIEIYISDVTRNSLQLWINDLSRDSYMKAGLNEGNLTVINSETIKQEHSIFIQALNTLIDYSKVLLPKAIDVPTHISQLKDILSLSVYSSMKDSYSYQIPWLCLDSIINELFKSIDPDLTINLGSLVRNLNNNLSLEDKKIALYQLLNFSLLTSYNSNDLFKLSLSEDNDDIFLLSNLILKSPLKFPDHINFSEMIIALLSNILINKKDVNSSDLDDYKIVQLAFNYCCEKYISLIDGKNYEDKFLIFYLKIFDISYPLNKFQHLINHLATLYAKGQFLDIEYIQAQLQVLNQV